MSKLRSILAIALALATAPMALAQDSVFVRGYYRSDGVYVRPHYRTRPDGNFWNNWSSYGNINPFTGERGYRLPSYYDNYGIGRLPSLGSPPSFSRLPYSYDSSSLYHRPLPSTTRSFGSSWMDW